MRSELNNFENIDRYLSGGMTGAEKSAFEAQINGDPALKSLVQDQQMFIQSVARKALLSEINAVAATAVVAGTAAGSGGFFGSTFWIVTSVAIVGTTTGALVYLSADETIPGQQEMPLALESSENSYVPTAQYQVNSKEDLLIAGENLERRQAPSARISMDVLTSASLLIQTEIDSVLQGGQLNSNIRITQSEVQTEERGVVASDDEISDPQTVTDLRKTRDRAEFTGGTSALTQYIKKNITYPETARRKGIEARVEVKFFVNVEGKLDVLEVTCLNLYDTELNKPLSGVSRAVKSDIRNSFEAQVLHTMNMMSDWQPQTDEFGNPLTSDEIWYFRFDIQDGIQFYNSKDL